MSEIALGPFFVKQTNPVLLTDTVTIRPAASTSIVEGASDYLSFTSGG